MNTTPTEAVASNAELGIDPERARFEYWLNPGGHAGNVSAWVPPGRYENPAHSLAWRAWCGAVAAERERCAKPVPDEWLVKVRRLVEGFEHVSGIARLWEPDYSTGSERALWARATEACADVAKLLAEAKKA